MRDLFNTRLSWPQLFVGAILFGFVTGFTQAMFAEVLW